MKKLFVSFYLLLMLSTIMTIGGVFASFTYAQGYSTPQTKKIGVTINEFQYGPKIPKAIQKMIEFADGSNKNGGFNITHYLTEYYSTGVKIEGVLNAYLETSLTRKAYGYVGSMDNAFGKNFHNDPSISVVMRYIDDETNSNTIYLYMVELSRELLDARNQLTQIDDVYKVGFKLNVEETQYNVIKDLDDNVVIERGWSMVVPYEGQENTNSFGTYSSAKDFWRPYD